MIEGEKIRLRTVKESDLGELFLFLDAIRMRGEFLPSHLISEQQFRVSFQKSGFWEEEQGAVLILSEERLVGTIWYEKQSSLLEGLDLRFFIFQEKDRGKGWMSEALGLFSAYLFASKKMQRLQLSIPDYSKGAFRVAQKCGFKFEGIFRSAVFHRGLYLDLCIYSLLRGECKGIEKIYD